MRQLYVVVYILRYIYLQDLIFVTDITDYIRGEKSVMWRNFRFL